MSGDSRAGFRAAAEHDHVAQEQGLGADPDQDPGPGRQRGRRDERLDHAGHQQRHGHADRDRDRAAALLGQRPGPWQRAGIDDPPAQPQARRRGQEHRGQLEHPVRQDQREELDPPPVRDHHAPDRADIDRIVEQREQGRDAEQDPEDQRYGREQGVVGPDLGRERGGRVLRVVAAELVVHQLPGLRGCHDAGLHRRRPGDPPAQQQRDQQRPGRGGQPPPAGPVGHGRERHHANRPTERHCGECAPVTAERARATRADSRAASAGSCPADRSSDRWVPLAGTR